MKDLVITYWKWLALGILLSLLGILVGTGLGTKRGTPLYRLRVRMWSAAVALAAAGGLVLSSSGCRGKDDDRPMCYDTVQVRDTGIDEEPGGSGEAQVTQGILKILNATGVEDARDEDDGLNAEDPAADDATAAEKPLKGKKGKPVSKSRKKKKDNGFISCYFPAE